MHDVVIPKLGQATVEVDVIAWRVAVGDRVEPGTIVAEVESEKTTVEIEAGAPGRVAEIVVPAPSPTVVGAVICRIAEAP
ncbi:MAG: acyltransferase [Alphaproteobacteria bacterium]|nr:acyltransferase [Alphaproteobacteria bacterium]